MTFQKGVVHKRKSPGRPRGFKGVAKQIMRETKDGKELVEFALKVFRDEDEYFHKRWQAMEWLADRGLGRPVEMVALAAAIEETPPTPTIDLTRLTARQREQLREVLLRALGRPRDVAATSTGNVLRLVDGDAIDVPTDDEPKD